MTPGEVWRLVYAPRTVAEMEELMRLDVPAQPRFVGVARSVVATVAATIDDLDDDRLDDLRLAVSEACTNAVAAGDVDRIVVCCAVVERGFEVTVTDTRRRAEGTALAHDDYALPLLLALVDEVTVSEGDGGTTVRLLVSLSG